MGYFVTGWIVPRYTMILGSMHRADRAFPPSGYCMPPWCSRRSGRNSVLFLGIVPHSEELAKGIARKAYDGPENRRLSG